MSGGSAPDSEWRHNPSAARRRSHLPGSARLVWRASRDGLTVALSFDDGPDPEGTPAILEVLGEAGIAATFFLLAERAERFPELVSRLVGEGHDVGLHADRHVALDREPIRPLARRLIRARRRLEELSGGAVRLHRPPFGRLSWRGLQAARLAGLDVVLWSHSPRDWDPDTTPPLAERLAACLEPGALVLLHDAAGTFPHQGRATAAALRRALPAIRSRGLRAVPVSAL